MSERFPPVEDIFEYPTARDYFPKLESYLSMDLPADPAELPVSSQPRSQRELDTILKIHQQWLQSVQNPQSPIAGSRAILRQCHLANLKFAGKDLRGVDFSGSRLDGADFSQCDLAFADISQCSVRGTSFAGARFYETNTSKTRMKDALDEGID